MKKNLMRILILLLVLVMLPFSAFAQEEATYEKKSNLPQVYITVTDPNYSAGSLKKSDGYVTCIITVYDPSGEYKTVSKEGKIKIRGNTTANGAKKPFNIKLTEKTDILGMGKAKKWSLLANMYDKTLMRNKLVFDFADDIGMDYVSQTRTVDVWLDGTYNGTYSFCEPVQIGSTRVDIDEDAGEVLFEREKSRYEADASYITTSRYGLRFVFDDPDEPTVEQFNALKEKLDAVETAIATDKLSEIEKYIDVESFVDMYIIEEYFKDVDADYSSAKYYFKDGLLFAGPVWDFDLAAGNCSKTDYYDYNNLGTTGNSYEGLYANKAIWFRYLLKNKEFYQLVRLRYAEIQPVITNLYQDNELGTNRMDAFLNECNESIAANWKVWNVASKDSSAERIPDSTYEANVGYLRNWLNKRNEWMLKNYSLLHVLNVEKNLQGSVELSATKAVVGQSVTVRVTPASRTEGWLELTALSITSDNGDVAFTKAEETENPDGTVTTLFTFTMPDADVSISTEFREYEYSKAVREVERLINAIGAVTETSRDAIEAARAAYEALSDHEKCFVSNRQTLTEAERAYAILLTQKAATSAQTAAESAENAAKAAVAAKNDAEKMQTQSGATAEMVAKARKAAQEAQVAAEAAQAYAETAKTAAQTAADVAENGEWKAVASAIEAAESSNKAAKQQQEIARTCAELTQMLLQAVQTQTEAKQSEVNSVRYAALAELTAIRGEVPSCNTLAKQKMELLKLAEQTILNVSTSAEIRSALESVKASIATLSDTCPSAGFSDLDPDAWYHEGVDFALNGKYMVGTSKTTFGPNENVTRGQLVSILYRMAGSPDVTGLENPFADVAADAYYAKAVIWAVNNKVVAGTSATTFDPEASITREQLAAMIYRYSAESAVEEDKLSSFTDSKTVSEYAKEAMNWAVANGLVSGVGNNLLAPTATATRAQIASIIMRYCSK